MKNVTKSISHFRFIFLNLKFLGEIATPILE